MSSNLKESSSISSIIQSRRQACLVVEQNINERRRGTFGQKVLAVHEITAILYYNIYIYIYLYYKCQCSFSLTWSWTSPFNSFVLSENTATPFSSVFTFCIELREMSPSKRYTMRSGMGSPL